jgi:hypothetical protein
VKSLATVLAAISFPFFSATTINFDAMKQGQAPNGWTSVLTSRGAPAQWLVQMDPSAPSKPNVLAQLSRSGPRFRFPLCLFDKVISVDGDVSVKMKIVSGNDGIDAGLVFRATGPDNYCLVRASVRDQNIGMYRIQGGHFRPVPVKGGKPGSLGVEHPIRVGEWNLLRVTYKGSQTTVYCNHRKLFDAVDTAIVQAGRAGLWTKGDTVACFDDFRIDKKK